MGASSLELPERLLRQLFQQRLRLCQGGVPLEFPSNVLQDLLRQLILKVIGQL